jgi:pimeloyl-ACP methyl ester carboxylesterase
MPSVALPGVDLWVERNGCVEGPPVLLLHGLGSSTADWMLQRATFGARYRVLALDLRGHGRSRPARLRLSIDRLAHDVAAALAALGERSVHVVGLSLGGCVGLALAAGDPTRVRSLTLVNSFARLSPSGLRGAVRLAKRVATTCVAPMPIVAAQVARALFPNPDQAEHYRRAVDSLSRNSRRTYLASMAAIATFDARRHLDAVRCPTLLIVGEHDRTVPPGAAEALRRGIPHAELLVVRNSGHATPYDQPETFNRVVLDFIARAETGNSSVPEPV